jgi:hypothetical protein
MKQCSVCKSTKPLNQFNKNSTRKDGRQTHCKECGQKHSRAYYAANREKHCKVVKVRKKREIEGNQIRLLSYLAEHPCVDCGEKDVIVLEFDHVRGVKRFAVSELLRRGNAWASIEVEIQKCEVRCANCHRRKTSSRGNHYRENVMKNKRKPVAPATQPKEGV